jgi:ketosteroid isomerase-like protein
MDRELRVLVEKDRIAAMVNRLFTGTDARDWTAVQACFADSVLFDMTSVAGGEPARLGPAQITAAWETGLAPIEAVHHQTGNVAIELAESEANVTCHGVAYHYRHTLFGRNTRVFVGSYDFHLRLDADAWKIDLFRFNLKFIDGNVTLEKEPPA